MALPLPRGAGSRGRHERPRRHRPAERDLSRRRDRQAPSCSSSPPRSACSSSSRSASWSAWWRRARPRCLRRAGRVLGRAGRRGESASVSVLLGFTDFDGDLPGLESRMDAAPAGTVAGQGITTDELRLAARNHALPLEALRYDITPPGLHYLLIHYDIPAVDPDAFRLEIGGAVDRPLTLSLEPFASGRASRADHVRVRRQRPRSARAAPGQPAVAHRGRRHGRVGRGAARAAARGGRGERQRHRDRVQGARPGRRGRRPAGLRARPADRGGAARAPRLRDERRARCRRSTASRCGWWSRAGTGCRT